MFNIGFAELLVIGVIALIFIGPEQLPEVARTIGRALNELRRTTDDLRGGFTADVRQTIHQARSPVTESRPNPESAKETPPPENPA